MLNKDQNIPRSILAPCMKQTPSSCKETIHVEDVIECDSIIKDDVDGGKRTLCKRRKKKTASAGEIYY
jgi:hypothetical protein